MINNLKELRQLLKLCRDQGVTKINLGAIAIELGDMPEKEASATVYAEEEPTTPYAGFPDEVMSPERLQYYAMGGTIEGDPFRDESH